MATLGSAFIEVHADTDPFAREVRRKLASMDKDLRLDIDKAASNIGDRLGKNIGTQLSESLNARLKDEKIELDLDLDQASVAKVEAGLRRVSRDRNVNVEVNRRGFSRGLGQAGLGLARFVSNATAILGDFFSFGRAIGQIFTRSFDEFSRASGTAGRGLVSMGTAVINLTSALFALAAVITLLIGLFGVILALVSALYQSVLLLLAVIPGLSAVALVSLAPLIIIFTNLGNALKNINADADTFRDAIDELNRPTQRALTSLRGLVQFFTDVRGPMQREFFRPINQAIRDLDESLGPTFRAGFEQVAGAAGRFAAAFISLFDHPEAAQFFKSLFDLGELAFDEIGAAGLKLFGAFVNLANETLPLIEEIVLAIADTIDGWATSLNEFVESEEFSSTIEEWQESFRAIADLTDSIWDTLITLIEGFRDDGLPVLKTAEDAFRSFDEFLKSDTGEEFFDGLRIAAQAVLVIISAIVVSLGSWVVIIGAVDEIINGSLADGLDVLGTFTANITLSFLAWLIHLNGGVDLVTRLVIIFRAVWEWALNVARQLGGWRGILRSIERGPLGAIIRAIRRAIEWVVNLRNRTGNLGAAFGNVAGIIRGIGGLILTAIGYVRTLLSLLGAASGGAARAGRSGGFSGGGGGGAGTGRGGATFGQMGGIFNRPTNMIIGEAGAEALIPLTKPGRAMELLEESGLAGMVQGSGGATTFQLTIGADENAASDGLLHMMRRAIRIRGGNVQVVLGS